MHNKNILHRDVKGANLLISSNHVVKVADFGLARLAPKVPEDMTVKVVTRWYRPPELLLGDNRYTAAIDMWSIGCIFGEMLLGRAPFRGNDDTDQLKEIFKSELSRLPFLLFPPSHPCSTPLTQ